MKDSIIKLTIKLEILEARNSRIEEEISRLTTEITDNEYEIDQLMSEIEEEEEKEEEKSCICYLRS
ncbi:hypothetical protein M0R19_03545 [Candidatus Pacearchaeota archaeon]|jgi:septal ring factor EnvC (AmiA/AmiB activator)|nr:hypothetical protein [Candidatus Pacearchaeota archaeon]